MKKNFVYLLILLFFVSCKKDKIVIVEPTPVLSMDGTRSVLVGEWEWGYSVCRVYKYENGVPLYNAGNSYATVDSGKFVLTHHITITPQADVIGTVNGSEVFRFKLNTVYFELDELPVSFLGAYYYSGTNNTLSFGIVENKGTHMKVMHDLLPFPSGNCYDNYKAEYHVLRKL